MGTPSHVFLYQLRSTRLSQAACARSRPPGRRSTAQTNLHYYPCTSPATTLVELTDLRGLLVSPL